MGRHQYHFLISHGLAPHHRCLDVACGSLRLGQWIILMLDARHYYGIEGEPSLVEAGRAHEMMFTHLTLDDIEKCFENMRKAASPDGKFFWTYFEGDGADNPDRPLHPNLSWRFR